MDNPMASEQPIQGNLQAPHDDPSARIWSIYLNNAEKDTERLAERWKGDMDAILIFVRDVLFPLPSIIEIRAQAGLFSASVTAFIIESYRDLVPDDSNTSVLLLAHIYRQISNDTTLSGVLPPLKQILDPSAFVAPTTALTCNILWFLSLSLSLTAALSATLVQQWTRNYLQGTVGRDLPHQRARISAYLYEGVGRFHMPGIVTTIPLLLHLSLLLFFAGLVEFLRPVNPVISYLIFGLLLSFTTLYILITFLPIFFFDCPYETPLTSMWWTIFRSMGLIRRRNSQGGFTPIPTNYSLAKVREFEATDISYDRDDRDFRAMCWTLEYSLDDSTLEMFAAVIPDVVAGLDYSAKSLCRKLLDLDDPVMRLGFRLTRLLGTCAPGNLDPAVAKRRSVSVLSAIWSLTMMAIPSSTTHEMIDSLLVPRDALNFDERTLRSIENVQRFVPDVHPHCLSAATAIARSCLDVFNDHALVLETHLSNYSRTGDLPDGLHKFAQKTRRNIMHQRNPARMLEYICKEAWNAEQNLMEQKAPSMLSSSSSLYTSLASLLRHIQDVVMIVLREEEPESPYIEDILHHLHCVQKFIRCAGFLLILEFIDYSLKSPSLPYETFNTTRRLYLRLNPENSDASLRGFPVHCQARLVCYLEDALDMDHTGSKSSRLPDGFIPMVLGLLRGVTDPKCVLKAESIISAYIKVGSSLANVEAAGGALATLTSLALPDETCPKILDIYSEHMYANTKLASTTSVDTSITLELNQLKASTPYD
ncbi:hypothetical protein D9757_002259 [Collybiopsis confluens]|uniref:DUF6535 domain-containing protein n=1 Tax=Collybiopsis confluens TaxID=2823264 RepID=A0A8H5MG73_9AGAR|nr:hypothetical protein D9757_002259 [Collybiopsis confluens]